MQWRRLENILKGNEIGYLQVMNILILFIHFYRYFFHNFSKVNILDKQLKH